MKKYLKTLIFVGFLNAFSLHASPIIIEFNENVINGSCAYYDMSLLDWEFITQSYDKKDSNPVYAAITFAASSADIFKISNYALNCELGHSHDFITSKASASSLVNFKVTSTGNYQLNFYGEMRGIAPFGGSTGQTIRYLFQDLSSGSIIIEEVVTWNEGFLGETSTIINNFFTLSLLKDHSYSLKLEAKIGDHTFSAGFISETNFLTVNIKNVPEPETIGFIFISFLSLFLLYSRKVRKIA